MATGSISRRELVSDSSSPDGAFVNFRTKVVLELTIIVQVQSFKKMTDPWILTIFVRTSGNNKWHGNDRSAYHRLK